MGRPLNKKYFGNRNVGADGFYTGDEFIGGEGVGSLTVTTPGSYTNTVPTVTFKSPSEPTGVTASASAVHVGALSALIDAIGSGYAYGDVLTLNPDGVWSGSQMSFSVTALTTVTTTLNNGGTNIDPGDEYTFSGTYGGGTWLTPLKVHIDTTNTGVVTGYHIVTPGVWSGAAAPTTTVGATLTQTAAGIDYNGSGLILNLTSWGVNAVSVATPGNHTAVPGNVSTSVTTAATPSSGRTGAKLFVRYGVLSVDMAEKGSGYISVADALPTFSTGDITTAIGAAVLTVDSAESTSYRGYGDLNVDTYQENAILIYAKTTTGGTVQLGDIKKQTNARSYKVLTADGTAVCKLVAGTPAYKQATITATDSAGKTYYVLKLTAHKALLVPYGANGHQFPTTGTEADGSPIYQSVKWTFGSATAGQTVTVAKA